MWRVLSWRMSAYLAARARYPGDAAAVTTLSPVSALAAAVIFHADSPSHWNEQGGVRGFSPAPREISVLRPIASARSTTALISAGVAWCDITMMTAWRPRTLDRGEIRRIGGRDEGAASTGPERIPSMREDRSASGNARIGRLGAEDPSISSGEVS